MSAELDLMPIFREEAGDRLDEIVKTLLEVEAGRAPADATDLLFRHAHSIKGSAGMVGCDAARAIAHEIEEVLEQARAAGALSPDQTEPLLRASDELRRAIAPQPEPAPVASTSAPAPVPALRIAAGKVDRMLDAVGENVLHHHRLEHLQGAAMRHDDPGLEEEMGRGELLLDELQHAVLEMRTLPLDTITGPFPRAIRDVAAEQGKQVELEITGADTQLDRVLLEGMGEAIGHLLRNAVAHGIERPDERERAGKPKVGRLWLHAEPRGSQVAITVGDDGGGVSAAVLAEAERRGSLVDVLAAPGFSTADGVSDLAGRGVGLDAVKAQVESIGGTLDIETEPGRGTVVSLLLPVTLALLHVLIVQRGDQRYGLPLTSVAEAVAVERVLTLGGRPSIEVRDARLPLADLARVLGDSAPDLPAVPRALVVGTTGGRVALACDRVLGEETVLVKPLGAMLRAVPGYLGASVLGDGRIILIIDPSFAVRRGASAVPVAAKGPGATERTAPTVLVVDDQFTVRELQRSILGAAGYRVEVACNGREALDTLARDPEVDLVVTDLQMPEMDGLTLLAAIRSDPNRSLLPVVVVTSRGTEEDRRRGAEAGADAYIVKDEFDQRALLATVEQLIGRR
jgi:two-component system chemotaxis sensor kinase CheA